MKSKLFYVFITLLSGFPAQLLAQTDSVQKVNVNTTLVPSQKHKQSNFIKINITGILLKNYSLQFERTLSRKFSIAVAYRKMPITTLPLKNQISKIIGEDDPDTKKIIENVRLGNYAITPEIRLYLSKKGYGQGFYIAPFYRYASFEVEKFQFDYSTTTSADDNTINLSGKLTANTGGLLMGVQKALGKHICLDTWIIGPHIGSGSGNFSGVSTRALTPAEQDELRQQLEDFDIPLTNKTVNVTANGASLKLDGPWAGVRAGLSIGVKF
ncbi:MAG: DUF3575 domain-containing protein [Bacteroidota bacterium]|nr:DUF3575 domain-containing protein [Bacteroidota bacterium]